MSEMVERVARAIWKQRYGFEPLPRQIEHDEAMDMARAAIEAMREPTEAMIAAVEGNGTLLDWCAMIDEALK